MNLGLGLFSSIIIGIIAGWLAEKIMKRDHGLLTNLIVGVLGGICLLYTSPSPRDRTRSRMPSSA